MGVDGGGPGAGMLVRGLRVVWRHMRAEPLMATLAVLGASIYSVAMVASAVVLGRVTDSVLVPAFDEGGVEDSAVWGAGAALLAVAVLRAGSIALRRLAAGDLTFRTGRRFRRGVGDTLVDVPLSYHRAKPAGELLAHADADVQAATDVLNPLPFTIGVLVLVAVSLVSLVLVDPILAVVGLVLFPALALLNRAYTKRMEAPAREVQERVGDVSALAHESFDGALVVKTLGLAGHEEARMAAAADALRSARVRVGRLRATFEPAIDALPSLGIIALLAVGSWRVESGAIEPGGLVQAMALFGFLAFPMRIVGYFLEELPRAVAATARMDEVLSARPLPDATRGEAVPDGPLSIRFEDVSFAYEPGTPVLDGVTFEVAAEEVVALVGATGAGKSTLCELGARLLEPTAGRVLVGGRDVALLDPDEVHAAVAIVFQESFLFADPVRENVLLGLDVDDGELAGALGSARAEAFVGALPEGTATPLGERGVTLSGGQRQRLALARALVRRPRVLLLDDATSAVDPHVESQILDALRSGRRATTLVVAHRLSTIRLADRVVFLDRGRVAAEGPHDRLLELPAYRRIVQAYEEGD